VKIDSTLKPLATGGPGAARARTEATGTRGTGQAAEVSISSASAQLSGASSGAPIDGARIAEIKQAIAEGRFQINAEAIADGLLDTARDLLQSQRKA